jgi:hypothetical protein
VYARSIGVLSCTVIKLPECSHALGWLMAAVLTLLVAETLCTSGAGSVTLPVCHSVEEVLLAY